jgi:putative FmdB family regulatory protein
MPIYAYRCSACGHAQDVLQKMSDPVLTECPACGASAYAKQVTAAGFQLKGSGWYVTDFRGGNNAAAPVKKDSEGAAATPAASSDKAAGKPADAASGAGKAAGKGAEAAAPAAAAPAAPSAPASGS